VSSLSSKVAVVVRARLLTTVVDTATGLSLVWLLPKSEFAVLGLLLFIYELLKQLALLGFPESILYYFEKLEPRFRRAIAFQTVRTLLATATLAALIMLGLTALGPLWLGQWEPPTRALVQRYLPLFAGLALLEIPTWPLTQILLALDRQRHAGLYQVSTSVMTLTALLGPLLLGMGIDASVHALLGYGALRFVGSLVWGLSVLPKQGEPLPKGSALEQARFAAPLGIGALVGRLNKYLDKLVVSTMLPAAALADYTVATYEIPFVTAFPYGVGAVMITRYVALSRDGELQELVHLWHTAVRKVSLLVVPVAIAFIVLAPDLIPLAFGEEYLGSVVPFQIFCGILLMRVAHYGGMLQAFGNTRGFLSITLLMLATNLVLSVPMTLWLGVRGTALATLLANVASLRLTLWLIGSHLKLSPLQVIPLRDYARVLTLACGAGAAAWAARTLLLPDDAPRLHAVLLVAILQPALYLAAGALTGVIKREDFHSLRLLLRPL
jgi:O-antigen/teichoic acid export membrane protein